MEKIYEENNNKKTNNKSVKKGRSLLLTSALMVIVAAAIFITANFGQTSFAAEVETRASYRLVNNNIGIRGVTGSGDFMVTPYYFIEDGGNANEGFPVLCIQYQKDGVNNNLYTAGDELTDSGLIWLLYRANNVADEVASANKDVQMAATWIYQTAVWVYQHRNTSSKLIHETDEQGEESWRNICTNEDCKCTEANCNPLLTVNNIRYGRKGETDVTQITTVNFADIPSYLKMKATNDGTTASSFTDSVYALVTMAESMKNYTIDGSDAKMVFSTSNAKQKEDGDYYIYGPILVKNDNGGNWSQPFKVSMSSQIDKAELVGKDGKAIGKNDTLIAGTELYVKFPKKSLTEEKKSASLHADSSIGIVKAVAFTSDGSQTMGFFEDDTSPRTANLPINFKIVPDVPDTGMTTAQTIYFIGLVVLLCGVGIVYANVKPKEAE